MISVGLIVSSGLTVPLSHAWVTSRPMRPRIRLQAGGDGTEDAFWQSSFDDPDEDWQANLDKQKDGSFWSSFEPSENLNTTSTPPPEDDDGEGYLDMLASLIGEEREFNKKEAERAEKVLQMEEWGFEKEIIENAMGVQMEEKDALQQYRQESYWDDGADLETVESHTRVDIDKDTNEPVRSQMVYVDEHTCIGCTNCAMIAQSTFYMNAEHGRARVFQQWGDDDETIQMAIETCPVDCIHYVPYDELKRLEIDRRDQNINFKARLVSQAENGNSLSHAVGGAVAFTAPQQISGNMGSRCNNCPSRGCKNCPMFGVGKNPEFEKREKLRLKKRKKQLMQQERENLQKSADL